jgi:hypothetical protein
LLTVYLPEAERPFLVCQVGVAAAAESQRFGRFVGMLHYEFLRTDSGDTDTGDESPVKNRTKISDFLDISKFFRIFAAFFYELL